MTLFNADDFGVCETQCRHILECRRDGVLTGVSLMPNSPYLPAAAELLRDDAALKTAVHLNLTEGICLSGAAALPLLVTEDGRFCRSFAELLFASLGKNRRELEKQIKTELNAQLDRMLPLLAGRPLRIDGHQHIQMIPLVMKSLADVLAARGLRAEYVRFSCEPLGPFLRRPKLWKECGAANLCKNLLLNLLGLFDRGFMDDMGVPPNRIMGLMFSGHMEYRLVSEILADMEKAAVRRGVDLELVMHPGWGIAEGESLDVVGGLFDRFNRSENRKLEYDCLLKLKQ